MASNDSGVDTSNDSNDSSILNTYSRAMDLSQLFENQLKDGFALPPEIVSTPSVCLLPGEHGRTGTKSFSFSQKWERSKKYLDLKNYFSKRKEHRLRVAASTCNVVLLTNLLVSGADPNCLDIHRRSPLHLASCRGYADIVELLLKHGANPNIIDSLGNTPLHLAVISASSRNFNKVVLLLVKYGANVDILDRSGKNPLELVKSKIRLLEQHRNPTEETKQIILNLRYLILGIKVQSIKKAKLSEDLATLEDRLKSLSTNDSGETDMIEDDDIGIGQLSIT